jgi:iron complex transport system ATP-binding protein
MMRLAAETVTVMLGARRALDGVSLALEGGTLIGLIGPNGAGKTTLLRSLAGLVAPALGRVTLDGAPIAALDRDARARAIGYLPQDGAIHWALPVAEIVLMGRLPHIGAWRAPGKADRAAAAAAMAALDIADLAARPATRLSGGEKARVLLARALAGEPKFLLADEPVAGLDPYHRLEALEHLAALADAGTSVVVVLHDLTLAARFCRRLVLVDRGRIVADAAPERVLTPETLAEVYRVEAVSGGEGRERFVLPWRRVNRP